MRDLTGSDEGDICNPDLPVISTAAEVDFCHRIRVHRHPRGQFLFSKQGNLLVSVDQLRWRLAPQQAIWIPAGRRHSVEAFDAVSYRSAFIDETASRLLWQEPRLLALTSLLKTLIDTAAEFHGDYRTHTPEHRLSTVIFDQLARAPDAQYQLIVPNDKRIKPIVAHWMRNPADRRNRSYWAARVGASERTIARLFVQQTGLGFEQWRQHNTVSHAIVAMHRGVNITGIANELGYHSASAFSSMFKKITGTSPSKFNNAI